MSRKGLYYLDMQQINHHILVVGVGGLGRRVVEEALSRGASVSVLVRNRSKLDEELGAANVSRLKRVFVGDGTNATVLDESLSTNDVDVVISGRGADVGLAKALAEAVKRNGKPKKLIWPAGATNVLADDGVTPNYKTILNLGPWIEKAYKAHGACIDAIKNVGITHVIYCPGMMRDVGKRSPVETIKAGIRVNRSGGAFVSYEDSAWVIVEAALTSTWDNQLVSAGTKQ